ncbi:MAG: Two-component, sigma54 specific, transcriptional regulator, Fis family [Parcubacteria group bacterium GW2011_GWA2_47_7]|nr:MAG: Two-component, sigma54 specific, transcriptional regulator, Fis family [Parcubacteria group bacterium GW2011_GWA2_47_7]
MKMTLPHRVATCYDTTMTESAASVLLVEDDQILLRMLANMLSRKGILVHEARSGVEGLVKVSVENPDLILLDVDMPQMDGITMLKNLRAINPEKHAPILMLTNMNNPNFIADAAELGAVEYLIKADWEIDAIVTKVEEKLRHIHRAT